MSGMRKAPPISISSPREMIPSLRGPQAVQRQQHRRRVVVDHGDCLGAGEFADQPGDQVVAVAALAAGQVELQVQRVARGQGDRLDGLVRQQGAAEVGMQHRAGQVEHPPHAAGMLRGEAFAGAPGEHRLAQFDLGEGTASGRLAQFVEAGRGGSPATPRGRSAGAGERPPRCAAGGRPKASERNSMEKPYPQGRVTDTPIIDASAHARSVFGYSPPGASNRFGERRR
ncbi:Uncharacterised protein [Pseudomonas aeruginosa]|nr:Uncharacterised protein [Pseudomonas aeruginosa]